MPAMPRLMRNRSKGRLGLKVIHRHPKREREA
jgi:hypothetical protein